MNHNHYFLVYNDHTHTHHLNNLIDSVKLYGKEFQIIVFEKEDIDPSFLEKNKNILEMSRGGGYWLWKPYIVNETFKKINEGDYLFYMDSTYYFTEDFTPLYEEFMKENDFLVWQNKPNEGVNPMKRLCKMDVIQKYGMEQPILNENANEYWAGAFLLKKTPRMVQMIQEWLDMCCNEHDITDEQSQLPNHSEFLDHRHDQSLLSIVLLKYNIPGQIFEKRYLQNVRQPY
jgi:hypothetical protein